MQIAADGTIASVECNAPKTPSDGAFGTAIPGIPNVHSHAFQRAMAGLAEHRTTTSDNFWTWRETMYRFANRITPDDLGRIAAQLYVEMLKAGFTSVAEFHYVHHQPSGQPYDDAAAMSLAILDAAEHAGIGLTHLPVLYMRSGFMDEALKSEQKRFQNNVNSFIDILNIVKEKCSDCSHQYGVAIHSLRAVPPPAMKELLDTIGTGADRLPVHIHIAEQRLEVDQCLDWCGQRPIEWLLENHAVDRNWCLVHATHMDEGELNALAKSGAVVGLCPTTEANLGDGLFPLKAFLDRGGPIAIGSDSNSSVSPIEELRWLEYGQRLSEEKRTVATTDDSLHTGTLLFDRVLSGGRQALGQRIGKLEAGYRGDVLVLNDQAPALFATPDASLLDTLIFAGNEALIKDVMVSGTWVVRDFEHRDEARIATDFREAVRSLRN